MKDLLKVIVFGGLFLIPFLPVYVENNFFFPFITGKNFAFRIIIEIVFASWVLLSLYDSKYRPKFSWILAAFASLLAVMAVANALGEFPLKSFWSNFERMDGYVTLVHVFMLTVVAGSVLTTHKLWSWFFHISVAVALCVAVYGLAQHGGVIEGGRARVDSRLGNAAYMAVYMLFHIFIVFFLFVRSKLNMHRAIYALIAAILVYTLLLTGTRGTFLGFIAGTMAAVSYVALFGHRVPRLRKLAIAGCVGLVVLVGGFFLLRESAFVQDSQPLRRIANIDLQTDLTIRTTIWSMAVEGVKERPVLGWGQGNFNYVFNEQYDPSLYNAEAWYDRVHNIFLDWLIAGGVLGLLAYLSIIWAAFYYLAWQPLRRKDAEPTFNVLERAVLIGLLIGYFVHNLVVFDNIISYIFFASILALIHSRVATPMQKIANKEIDERLITQIAVPIVIIVTGLTIYFVNQPGRAAAADIIDALRQPTLIGRLTEFHEAISRESFADQEIIEQLTQNAMSVARNPQLSAEQKQAFIQRSELEMLRLIDEKPNDARLHSFFSGFYRNIGALPEARTQAALARSLSPNKQMIIIEQGIIELQIGDVAAARNFFGEAFLLDESFTQARVFYAAALTANGEIDEVRTIITPEYLPAFALNDYALSVVDQSGAKDLLIDMFAARIAADPQNAQNHASLAFIHYQQGDTEQAVKILEEASSMVSEFAPTAECFIANIKAGNEPDAGC